MEQPYDDYYGPERPEWEQEELSAIAHFATVIAVAGLLLLLGISALATWAFKQLYHLIF